MRVYLLHHAAAVGPGSISGRCRPAASRRVTPCGVGAYARLHARGDLAQRQVARAADRRSRLARVQSLAEFKMVRGLGPDDRQRSYAASSTSRVTSSSPGTGRTCRRSCRFVATPRPSRRTRRDRNRRPASAGRALEEFLASSRHATGTTGTSVRRVRSRTDAILLFEGMLDALDVNATDVVHSGGSGNNGGYHTNPEFLEVLPNETSS